MILSEFAGAAQSLNGSLIINPWDVQSTADAIKTAITMSPEQRRANHQKLFKVSWGTGEWAPRFGPPRCVTDILFCWLPLPRQYVSKVGLESRN
jgi:hypothetical protein